MNYTKEITTIYSNKGIKGLFKGFWITFLREIPGWGVYFGSYEYFKNEDYNKYISGGLSGFSAWLIAIP
jgi:solute carrier family 25 carnitine/acylcarnitine transporter 20/29